MAIFSVYVVNKAGGLIYQWDSYSPRAEAEKTFSYPLDLLLKLHDERVLVAFGQRDGIRGGLGWARGRGRLCGSGLVGGAGLGGMKGGVDRSASDPSSLLQWAMPCWLSMAWT